MQASHHPAAPGWAGCGVAQKPRFVQIPFASTAHDAEVTTTELRPPEHPADSLAAERLWEALSRARADEQQHRVADLEDALFRLYLPMALTLAHGVTYESSTERLAAEQAAELGLAHAVLGWQQPTSGGFRRFARATILRQLNR